EQADRCASKDNMKIAERTEEAGYRKIRQSLFGLESFFQRQLWPARLGLVAAGLAIAILLGALFFKSGLQLYENWHQTQLLHRATSMLQQGRFSEATQTARELLAQHPDSLPTKRNNSPRPYKKNQRMNSTSLISRRCKFTPLMRKRLQKPAKISNGSARSLRIGPARCARCLMML